MKNFILSFAILLAGCALTTSCSSGEENGEVPGVQVGVWKMSEMTITTPDAELNRWFMRVISMDMQVNETTRIFGEYNVTTTVRKKGTSNTTGLVREATEAYRIEGDTIYVENSDSGTTVSRFSLSKNTLTTYRTVSSEDIGKLLLHMGEDPNAIPAGITGELKIRESR